MSRIEAKPLTGRQVLWLVMAFFLLGFAGCASTETRRPRAALKTKAPGMAVFVLDLRDLSVVGAEYAKPMTVNLNGEEEAWFFYTKDKMKVKDPGMNLEAGIGLDVDGTIMRMSVKVYPPPKGEGSLQMIRTVLMREESGPLPYEPGSSGVLFVPSVGKPQLAVMYQVVPTLDDLEEIMRPRRHSEDATSNGETP